MTGENPGPKVQTTDPESDPKASTVEDCIEHREALIDQSLEESFPASDPPSIAKPACS